MDFNGDPPYFYHQWIPSYPPVPMAPPWEPNVVPAPYQVVPYVPPVAIPTTFPALVHFTRRADGSLWLHGSAYNEETQQRELFEVCIAMPEARS